MNLLFCTIAGLVVGSLAANWRLGYERNRTMDLVMGAAGGFTGGILFIVSIYGAPSFSILGAVLGAILLILVSRYVDGSRESDAIVQRVAGVIPAPAVVYGSSTKRGL